MKLDPNKWYFRTYVYVMLFLCISPLGPLALPLVWINPRYSTNKKIIITVISLIIGYFLIVILAKSITSIFNYYQLISQLSK